MADGLVAALARCQAKFPPIVKSHTNPAFKGSQYADVADVLAAVRPVLAAEGIVVTQQTAIDDEGVVLITALLHGSEARVEQRMESRFPLAVQGLTAQQVGSLMTYHRRYQLCALLGVHPVGDDDDGNLAAAAQTYARSSSGEAGRSGRGVPDAVGGGGADVGSSTAVTDSYKAAAENPPEKPLAAMTAGEMARYGESIGVRVSGNKSDILRQLEPYVKAADGEPFDLEGAVPLPPKDDAHDKLFEPVVASSIGDEPQ